MIPSPYREGAGNERLGTAQVVALAFAVVVCRLLATHSFHIYDDAFITYRYAQNLAAGHGLVFNPGAPWEPVLGTTTPLYALLLAGPVALGADVLRASLAINVLCDGLTALLLARLLAARPLAAMLAVLAFAAIPEVGRVSVGGMEPPLFVLLAVASICAAEARRLPLAGWLAAFDCTVRPEGVLLLAALGLAYLRSWSDARRFLTPVSIVGLSATALLTWIYGDPIPQSVQAKAGTHGLGLHVTRIWEILGRGLGPSWAMKAALPLTLLGFALALLWRTPVRAFVLFALSILAAYCAVGVKTWGWYFYVPLVAWCAALGIGTDALLEFLGRARPALKFERLGARAPLILSAVVVAAVASFSRQHTDRVTERVYGPMAAWAAEQHLERDRARVVASDIGAIGFFGRTQILDSEGLVWPQAREFASQVELIRVHQPDFVLLVVNRFRIKPFVEDPVSALYEPLVRFNTTGDTELAPDPAKLPTWWEQDYIVYRRRDYAKRTE